MHEERAPGALERLEQRGAAVEARRRGQRLAGKRQADEALVEPAGDIGSAGVLRVQAGGRERAQPASGALGDLRDAVVVGVEQRPRLRLGQRLDADGGRDRDDRDVDPAGVERLDPAGGVVVGGADRTARLVGEIERRRAVAAGDARRPCARGERCEELLRPQVLVQIDARGFAPFRDL
jgi:hypothetical protein